MNRPVETVAAALLALAVAAGPAAANLMSGEEIRETVNGKRIFLATPFGGEFPMNYRANGQVDADGEALGLGRFARPQDSGRWWIAGDKLCQKWTTWENGRTLCFTLKRTGPKSLWWVRSDGLEGAARIGN